MAFPGPRKARESRIGTTNTAQAAPRENIDMAKASRTEKKQAEYGSDVVVDMLKAFDIEYTAFNPGASFRGIHDSIVNYGGCP